MRKRLPLILVLSVLAVGAGLLVSRLYQAPADGPLVAVKVPRLSDHAARGEAAFEKNCAACHGNNAAGGDKGPPLVHDIYNPGHHSDASFVASAKRGVRRHHWNFGDMPPQPQVSDDELIAIIRYVRELQRANGIFYRPHRM